MPFIAKLISTGQRIDITRLIDPKRELKSGDCACQFCEQPMIVKAGPLVQAHFAHYIECQSDYERKPESPDHLALKSLLRDFLVEYYQGYESVEIALEVPIPEIKRVADILVVLSTGYKEAHEVQLSRVDLETIRARTEDYASAGIEVFWYFGPNAKDTNIRDWLWKSNLGQYLELEISSEPIKQRIDVEREMVI